MEDKHLKQVLEVKLCLKEMERVHQEDRREGVLEWAVLVLGLVPEGTVFVPVAEKKYLINRVRLVST